MNIFQKIAVIWKSQKSLGELQSEFAMKISTNMILQVIATILQLVNSLSGILPKDMQVLVTGLLGGVQMIVAAIGHYSNPDGTSVKVAYVKEIEK